MSNIVLEHPDLKRFCLVGYRNAEMKVVKPIGENALAVPYFVVHGFPDGLLLPKSLATSETSVELELKDLGLEYMQIPISEMDQEVYMLWNKTRFTSTTWKTLPEEVKDAMSGTRLKFPIPPDDDAINTDSFIYNYGDQSQVSCEGREPTSSYQS